MAVCLAAQTTRFNTETAEHMTASLEKHKNNIPALVIGAQTGNSMNISCPIEGFKDRNYQYKMEVLDITKRPIAEIKGVTELMPKIDDSLHVTLETKNIIKNNKIVFISEYLKITVSPSENSLYDLTDNKSDYVYLYNLNKIWKKNDFVKKEKKSK